MTKVLTTVAVTCMMVFIFALLAGIGLWYRTYPPSWFFFVLAGSCSLGCGAGATAVIVNLSDG